MAIPTLDDIRADLRTWFDGVDGVSEETWKRFYDFWLKLENDAPQIAGWHQTIKSGANVDVYRGQAWFEQGGSKMMTLLDDVRSIVAHYPGSPVHLVGKRHLPARFVGRWRQIGVSKDGGDTFDPPAAPVEWNLRSDGVLETVGDPKRSGWQWSVHEGGYFPKLLLRPASDARSRVISVHGFTGDELELSEPPKHTKWRRA
jgi:hypothetical protein